MVTSFQLARLPIIYFGQGKVNDLPGLIKGFGNRVLLVTGKSSFMSSEHGKKLLNVLNQSGIRYTHIIITQEPTTDIIDDIVKNFRNIVLDVVVSIGGGSVIDAGKAISAMMYRDESVTDFLEVVGNKNPPGGKVPFIAIPTTSGTGSEVTKNAVISGIGREGFKRSLRHDNYVPDVALIDPELTISCTPEITAASGMDSFTQLLEAYLSVKSNDYTDCMAITGLRALKSSLMPSYINGENIDARSGMSYAALTSGICLANAGLGVVHGFASSIGGMFNIPHGLVCGTLMAVSNEVNVKILRKQLSDNAALKKYAIAGELFLDIKDKSEEFYIDGFISYLHNLTEDLHLSRLRNFGVDEKDIGLLCSKTEIKNNPVKLAPENLLEILSKRL